MKWLEHYTCLCGVSDHIYLAFAQRGAYHRIIVLHDRGVSAEDIASACSELCGQYRIKCWWQ